MNVKVSKYTANNILREGGARVNWIMHISSHILFIIFFV